MELISELMGVSFGQADIYRRALEKPEKGKNVKIVKEFNDTVIQKAVKLGFSEKVADEVRKLIVENSGYGFNKCLSGNEKIYKDKNQYSNLTIEEMYLIKNNKQYAKENNKMILRNKYITNGFGIALSMNEKGRLVKNKIIDITFSGIKKVYLVETETGEKVKCTMNHKFPTPNGKKLLSQLKIGDYLYVKEQDDKLIVNLSKIKNITFLDEENTYNIEMADPYHNLLMNDGIIVCNSHAVCYSIISYWTAWMKVNYPLVFYTVMLNSCDEKDFILFMNEAKNDGIKILPPHVNKSKFLCTIENNTDIRIGLQSIKGVGPAAVQCIEKMQPFDSINDFFNKKSNSVNKKVVQSLVNIGALENLSINIDDFNKIHFDKVKDNKLYLDREQMKLFFKLYYELSEQKTIPNYLIPISLIKGKYLNDSNFDIVIEKDSNSVVIPDNQLINLQITLSEVDKEKYKTKKRPKGSLVKNIGQNKLSKFEKILNLYYNEINAVSFNILDNYISETSILGYSFVEHPCNKFINKIYKQDDPQSTFNTMNNGEFFMTCGIINELEEKLTKNNKKFYLITLITPVDIVKLQLWDNQYKKYINIIKNNNIIKVSGTKGFGRVQVEKIGLIKSK